MAPPNIFQRPERLERLLNETMRGLGEDAELIFQAHARHRTGRMARNIKSDVVGRTVVVSVEARNPQTGFDYVAVTRFGHRVARIYPQVRSRATVLATGNRRKHGKKAMLRFVIGGRVFYRHSVKGFKPEYDWADRAMPEVNQAAERAMAALGRKIILSRF